MKTRIYFLDNLRTFLIFLVILYHAAFTYQSAMESNWIVVDNAKNDSIGLVGLYIDIFVMALMFFISGYFIPKSLRGKSSWQFIKSKFSRIMVPWAVAVLTLIPAYEIIYLYSRGLLQEEWYTYFHWFQRAGADLSIFSNDPSQHWLWFLPVLFLFQVLYLAMSKAKLLSFKISLKGAVLLTFVMGLIYSMAIAILGLKGWSLNILLDFQRERLLVYFALFLLGSLCYKLGVFETDDGQKKYMVLFNIILTIALSFYTVITINFLINMVNPARNYFFVSQRIDGIAYYSSLLLSMLALLYILIHVFRSNFSKINKIMTHLNRNSYYVYIIHMIVLGIVGLAMTNISLPVWIKYATLTILTFVISNLLVYAYYQMIQKRPALKIAAAATFIIGFFIITSTGGKDLQDHTIQQPDQNIGLHEAVVQGDLEAVKQHIKIGSDLNVQEPSGGSSPLITAAMFGKPEIARVLVEAGADVNLKNNEGSTALITAAFFCRKEIVEILLANGADKSIRNNSGSTAFDSVIGPCDDVKGIYDYFVNVFGPMGFKLDLEQVKRTRPVIAEMLK